MAVQSPTYSSPGESVGLHIISLFIAWHLLVKYWTLACSGYLIRCITSSSWL